MATMMFLAEATRSIAPPMPFTILLGIFQLAMSPISLTSIAPGIVRSTCSPRIMANESAEENKEEPGSVVTVCSPMLMRSAKVLKANSRLLISLGRFHLNRTRTIARNKLLNK